MTLKPGNWCYRCGASDTEPAREGCKNPSWHVPIAKEAVDPERRQEPEARLPYADD